MNTKLVNITEPTQLISFISSPCSFDGQKEALPKMTEFLPIYNAVFSRLKNKYSSPCEEITYEKFLDSTKAPVTAQSYCTGYWEIYNQGLENTRDYVCILQEKSDDIYNEELLLAGLYAKLHGRKFRIINDKSQLETLIAEEAAASILLFVKYDKLDITYNFKLTQRYKNILLGYVPYTDKYTINFYLIKTMLFKSLPNNGSCMIFNRVPEKNDEAMNPETHGTDLHYFPKSQCTLEELEQHLHSGKPLLEFSYISHSRECSMVFNDFFYCGTSDAYKASGKLIDCEDKHKPCCHYDKSACYLGKRKNFSASALNADILFLNACNLGDLNRSEIPYDFSVTAALLESNATAITTNPGIKTGHIAENLLAHNLLMEGYSEGEKIYYLNKLIKAGSIENSIYFLIGDPTLKAAPRNTAPYKSSIGSKGADEIEVQFDGISGSTYIEIALDKELYGESLYVNEIKYSGNASIGSSTGDDIYFLLTAAPDTHLHKLMLFTKKGFKADLRVTVGKKSRLQEYLKALNAHRDNLSFYKNCFNLDNSIKGKIVDIDNNFKSIYTLYNKFGFSAYTLGKVEDTARSLSRKFTAMFKDIFAYMTENTKRNLNNFLEDISEERSILHEPSYKTPCIACGDTECSYPYEILTLDRSFRRTTYKCYSCGIIRDVPDELIDFKSFRNLRFESQGSSSTVLELTNLHDVEVSVSFCPICIDTEDIEVQCDTQDFVLKPNEKASLTLYLKPLNNLRKYYYLFSFYIMVNGKLYFISKSFGYGE